MVKTEKLHPPSDRVEKLNRFLCMRVEETDQATNQDMHCKHEGRWDILSYTMPDHIIMGQVITGI